MGHAAQPNEITSQRRRGLCDPRKALAEPRRGVDHRERNPHGPRISPAGTGFVKDLLEGGGLFVPNVINPWNPGCDEGGFSRGQKARGGEKVEKRGFPPYTQKTAPCKPARRFDHEDSAPV